MADLAVHCGQSVHVGWSCSSPACKLVSFSPYGELWRVPQGLKVNGEFLVSPLHAVCMIECAYEWMCVWNYRTRLVVWTRTRTRRNFIYLLFKERPLLVQKENSLQWKPRVLSEPFHHFDFIRFLPDHWVIWVTSRSKHLKSKENFQFNFKIFSFFLLNKLLSLVTSSLTRNNQGN